MKNNYRTDRPQDEIPEDIWIQNLLDAYHKEHEELEFLRSFAQGLEEENVQLKKELDRYAEKVDEEYDVVTKNKILKNEIERLKRMIEETYPIRVMKLSTYKKIIQQQGLYINQMEKLLDANGIEYHKISRFSLKDINKIAVNAVRKPSDLGKC